ncbi:MAG: hypothetical protein N4A33_11600 [Bacteriovoracaceae bacterium]|jgi:C1A family cysteine protease|nr:hypothetical protein [Bacteriovoracaceae bacterium]
MKVIIGILLSSTVLASLPVRYTQLLSYVQEAPDQGDTATCLYMATTGSVELLLNQKYNIKYPNKNDIFDISERYTLSQRASARGSWHLKALNRFNKGWAINNKDLEYNAYTQDGQVNNTVWNRPRDFYDLPRIDIPEKFKAKKIFIRGKNRYSKYVVKKIDIENVKKALVENNAPILMNYNHNRWWHMVNIVGYDDEAKGECLHTPKEQCSGKGAFYVRDSLGKVTHLRDYDWFRVNANAAFVVTLDE